MVEVEVLAVSKITDIVTGQTAAQVHFGEMTPADPDMRQRFVGANQQPPVGAEALHVILSVIVPPSQVDAYRVGSKWILEQSNVGEILLKRKP